VKGAAAAGLALLLASGCAAPGASPPPVGAVVLLPAPAGPGAAFVGTDACRGCHPAEYARWRATAHAGDHAGLAPSDRSLPACLRCHVTGYREPRGFGSGASAPDLAAVGCEACHGPGADHARSRHPELVPTATGGDCPPCEINRICRLCHTPERSPGFDLGRALGRVACGGTGRGPR
jgi:hypothetical protein